MPFFEWSLSPFILNTLQNNFENVEPPVYWPFILTVKVFVIVLCFLPLLAWAEAEAKAEAEPKAEAEAKAEADPTYGHGGWGRAAYLR